MGIIYTFADLLALTYASFFLKDPLLDTRPSWLFLYFSSREVRSAFYIGLSAWILSNNPSAITALISKISSNISIKSIASATSNALIFDADRHLSQKVLSAAFLGVTGASGMIKFLSFALKKEKRPGDWRTFATDGLGWTGLWWIGLGSKEWFAFIGHNSQSEALLPKIFMEQMKRQETYPDESNLSTSSIQEINDDEVPETHD
ncbi:hypothetical protein HK098_006987 [Nowakowskiella sp. JEL0407]|nr:hypothetical protein HK098_006987 [Nowakowskiella sp. JEL0407]